MATPFDEDEMMVHEPQIEDPVDELILDDVSVVEYVDDDKSSVDWLVSSFVCRLHKLTDSLSVAFSRYQM